MRNMIYSFFDDPRISCVIKEFVKTGQRVDEELTSERQRLVQHDEQAVVKGRLAMMNVFVCFTEILLRVLVESLLAAQRTEVISLFFVFGLASGGCWVNVHTADGIVYCSCHRLSPFI
jgi:hypothetical protein